jgi:hypothetical protein
LSQDYPDEYYEAVTDSTRSRTKYAIGVLAQLLLVTAYTSVAVAGNDTNPKNHRTKAPYSRSTLIESIQFSGLAIDGVTSGDQLVITWTDDGHQYAAWGDGTGFGYRGGWNNRWTTYLGIPRVEGNPPDHKGYNIWGGYQPESESSAFYRNRQSNTIHSRNGTRPIVLAVQS